MTRTGVEDGLGSGIGDGLYVDQEGVVVEAATLGVTEGLESAGSFSGPVHALNSQRNGRTINASQNSG
ncbi:hypothetical protein [Streptomyces showdoensis]|uniref:Uncharacterized protein n=1 Tax=Streptomyces showdoensis TaxID=68268 RepID=A0A2P2GEC2_STREW|nr:hypothetical protein [Streptomyces showdoensis]KKZ69886.1 hypothetical protein VO63_31905 [Streptomyces showdoensis]